MPLAVKAQSLKKKFFFNLFMAAVGLCCCVGFSLVAVSGGYSLAVVYRLVIAMASRVAEHGLQGEWASVAVARGLRSCVSGLQSSRSTVVVQELSYFVARGIFLDQGLNLHLLNWQLDFFFPLSYQGSLKA